MPKTYSRIQSGPNGKGIQRWERSGSHGSREMGGIEMCLRWQKRDFRGWYLPPTCTERVLILMVTAGKRGQSYFQIVEGRGCEGMVHSNAGLDSCRAK